MTDKPSREEALAAVKTLISWAGDDPTREGLVETPDRVIRAYREFFAGYEEDPEQVLAKSLVAENKLNKLIDEVKTKNNLKTDQIIIGGFSQGCMITLQTGLKRKDSVNSVIGYSGRIIDIKHLSKNINSRPKISLMHGDIDQVVSIDSLLEAKDFFNKNNYEIETKIFKNCEHRIPTEGSSLGLQFIKKQFNS